jgi:hypothetical protein
MDDDEIRRQVREAIRKLAEVPVSERIEDMISRGVIDRNGRILLKMPTAPRKRRKSGKARSDGSPS